MKSSCTGITFDIIRDVLPFTSIAKHRPQEAQNIFRDETSPDFSGILKLLYVE